MIQAFAYNKNDPFFNQGMTRIKCGDYEIEAPENHLLIELLKLQPYRDLCVGISAKYISAKYPNRAMIDIGANIGDTAAMMATYASNPLILVEASDYFFDILVHNTAQFPNEVDIKKVLIADGSEKLGNLYHWGGTAFFHQYQNGIPIKTERLSKIAGDNTCFVKIDADGCDFEILADSFEWLASAHAAILFENQIRNHQDLSNANQLYDRLMQIGYSYFIVWDDPGFHLLSTSSLQILMDLNRYLFKLFEKNDVPKSIYNYDVLCLHKNDQDIYENIHQWYQNY
jgi:FkbM family methyltransferase